MAEAGARVWLRIADILRVAHDVARFVEEHGFDDVRDRWDKRFVLERAVEIVSEASRHLPDDLKRRNPHIPWRAVAGVGNVLRHGYDGVDVEVIWQIATIDLPVLAAALEVEAAAHPPPDEAP